MSKKRKPKQSPGHASSSGRGARGEGAKLDESAIHEMGVTLARTHDEIGRALKGKKFASDKEVREYLDRVFRGEE